METLTPYQERSLSRPPCYLEATTEYAASSPSLRVKNLHLGATRQSSSVLSNKMCTRARTCIGNLLFRIKPFHQWGSRAVVSRTPSEPLIRRLSTTGRRQPRVPPFGIEPKPRALQAHVQTIYTKAAMPTEVVETPSPFCKKGIIIPLYEAGV